MKTMAKSLVMVGSLLLSANLAADEFVLKSKDFNHGEFLSSSHEFKGFGCTGDNLSPQLSWSGAPEGTKAFALMVYDPDAPTGSGWWHWQVVNIPVDVSALPQGAGNADNSTLPKGARQISNDYSVEGFGGPCPPKGHGAHRYQFSLHALSKKLDFSDNPKSAVVGYMVKAHSLATANLQGLYKRD